jgi:ribosomal protein S18 acetylase RimI-like enzyme
MTSRLAGILKWATQQIMVAALSDDSRIDGYVGLERRLTLQQDEHVEITDLVVDAAARRSGLSRALVTADEQWAAQHGLHTMVVRSNVVRPESRLFYEGIGYQRTAGAAHYRAAARGSAAGRRLRRPALRRHPRRQRDAVRLRRGRLRSLPHGRYDVRRNWPRSACRPRTSRCGCAAVSSG